MRQGILSTLVLGTSALVLASSVSAGADRSSCPSGFTAYAVPQTEANLLQFPRIAAGLSAVPAPYTAQELLALAVVIDGNQDGIFCLKAVSNLAGASTKHWGYFYGARDNDTAAG
jgi:hypothetical protein